MIKSWTYDIETLINCIIIVFISVVDDDISTPETKIVFEISERRNDLTKIREFVKEELKLSRGFVGYNNLAFDSPIIEYILAEATLPKNLIHSTYTAYSIYTFAQKIISDDERPSKFSSFSARELDLYLMYHFDNAAKRTSLKWIECHLGMPVIAEMPHPHNVPIKVEDIDDVISYCVNDVKSTKSLLMHKKTRDLLKLRQWAIKKYHKKSLLNYSDSSIGEYILKQMIPVPHGEISHPFPEKAHKFKIKSLILSKIEFKTDGFKNMVKKLGAIEIDSSVKLSKIKYNCSFDAMQYEFGLGGLHAARKQTIYTEPIHTIDAVSYYPNIAIQFGISPKHLGDDFVRAYAQMFGFRLKSVPKSVENAAWKQALNSAFGKSNSEYSFLYDPSFTYAITINGQLLLAMLCEDITLSGAGQIVMANTDGIEVKVFDEKKLAECIGKWEVMTRINLETDVYSKLMIRDVNNYIGIKKNGDIKSKGAYEIEKEFHKDPSMKVVPKMLEYYFQMGTFGSHVISRKTIVEVLQEHLKASGLNDFFMYQRAKTGKIIGMNPQGRIMEMPKTIRYVAVKTKSSEGGYTLLRKTDKSFGKIHADTKVAFLNDSRLKEDESTFSDIINYEWYAMEIEKLIVNAPPPSLF